MSEVMYSEHPVPGGARTLPLIVLASVVLVALAIVTDFPAVAALAGTAGLISLFLIPTQRYYGVTVDRETLRVGKDQVPLSDLDPAFGVRRGTEVLDDGTLSSLEVGVSSTRGDLRILGGSWGRPKNASTWLVVQDRQGGRHLIASRDPEALTAALGSAMTTR